MPLTELQIKNAKSQPGKSVRLYDQRGLYLEISESGSRWWRLKYRYMGKEKRLSLGVYPETSLKRARERCDEARKLLSNGVDPSQQRKTEKLIRVERAEDTFEKIGRDWYKKQAEIWVPDHAKRILSRLENDIFPLLGERPVTEIEGSRIARSPSADRSKRRARDRSSCTKGLRKHLRLCYCRRPLQAESRPLA